MLFPVSYFLVTISCFYNHLLYIFLLTIPNCPAKSSRFLNASDIYIRSFGDFNPDFAVEIVARVKN